MSRSKKTMDRRRKKDRTAASTPRDPAALLILASASPGRAGLLRAAGFRFRQIPSALPEPPRPPHLSIRAYLLKLAAAKAQAVASDYPAAFVIGADTVLEFEGRIIGKAPDADQALALLRRLRGKTHRIWTAVCLVGPTPPAGRRPIRRWIDTADVTLRAWSDAQIRRYIRTARPFFCAGAYAVQADGLALVRTIRGDLGTVIGLPLDSVARHLEILGFPRPTQPGHPAR